MGGVVSVAGKPPNQCRQRDSPDTGAESAELTESEKQIVRSQWVTISDNSDRVCADVFSQIFELKPEAKQLFPFRNIEGAALIKHPYFRGHATRFLNAVKMTIVNLDAWEVILIPNLFKLGQQHTTIKGFKPEYFTTFFKAMDYTWNKHLGKAYNSEARSAWSKIFRLIMSTVEEGYLDAINSNTSQSHVSGEMNGQMNQAKET